MVTCVLYRAIFLIIVSNKYIGHKHSKAIYALFGFPKMKKNLKLNIGYKEIGRTGAGCNIKYFKLGKYFIERI